MWKGWRIRQDGVKKKKVILDQVSEKARNKKTITEENTLRKQKGKVWGEMWEQVREEP